MKGGLRIQGPMMMFSLLVLLASCGVPKPDPVPEYRAFQRPEQVTVAGYDGDAMEPFLTRDGRYLLFNNRNDPEVNTNLHFAERIDDLHFEYRGEIQGVNTEALEGVPSMNCDGTLYFVSTRSYAQTFSTIYQAHFAEGKANDVEVVRGISRQAPGWVNFDAEISADGQTLYFVDSEFRSGRPASAQLVVAKKKNGEFVRAADSNTIFAQVNTRELQYAPAISTDELELFFTRVKEIRPDAKPRIWRAVRRNRGEAFDAPQLVSDITGFAEGPTISVDGRSLYYHARVQGRFVIMRVTRPAAVDVHQGGCSSN